MFVITLNMSYTFRHYFLIKHVLEKNDDKKTQTNYIMVVFLVLKGVE